MRLVFIGPPGAGKGTQSARLIRHFGIPHLSTGEMLREAVRAESRVGRLAKDFMEQGQLVPDPIILEIVGHRLDDRDCQGGYLFDGFPRTLGQAAALDDSLRQRGTPLNAVLELKVNEEQLIERLAGRGREDDRPEVIRQRFKAYHEQTAPLVAYYQEQGLWRPIEGMGTQDEVFQRILQALAPPA